MVPNMSALCQRRAYLGFPSSLAKRSSSAVILFSNFAKLAFVSSRTFCTLSGVAHTFARSIGIEDGMRHSLVPRAPFHHRLTFLPLLLIVASALTDSCDRVRQLRAFGNQ